MEVADAVSIGTIYMLSVFRRSLQFGFHAKMSSPLKTLDYMKRGFQFGRENCVRCRVYISAYSDGRVTMANGSSNWRRSSLISCVQYRGLYLFLVDKLGGLRWSNKATMMNRLGIKLPRPRSPDIVIFDGQQLLYNHVT